MVRRAILSDIHGNVEALSTVLEDIDAQGIPQIYCLGDIVGYGPNPCECLDAIMQRATVCVLGNHDQGALFDPEGFSSGAERAIFWTRQQLEKEGPTPRNQARWQFLCDLPRHHREDKISYVHGSVRQPLNEYVFPEDVYNARKMQKIFAIVQRYAFQGHTHVPGVFTARGEFFAPEQLGGRFSLGSEKVMINVGSVGQPRDGDARACYVVQSDDQLEFRRVAYPLEQTVEKIFQVPELDNFLGERLRQGR